jgi:uncharacterized membrane protein YdjX (TVP38/TMEM64 family)
MRIGAVLLVLLAGFAAFQWLGLGRYLSLDSLAENRDWLLEQVARHGIAAAGLFIGVYAVAVALSFPGAFVLTIAGGFLFGPVLGTAYAVTGATAGAVALFLFVRAGMGDALRSRAGSTVDRFRQGFSESAMSYILFLRLLPVFPFWLVNLAAALLQVPLRSFVIATAIGIIPGTAVYAYFGSGIGGILDQGGSLTVGTLLTPEVIAPLVALAVLAIAPALYQRFARSRRTA